MPLYFLLSNLTFALPPVDKSIASPQKLLRDARWNCIDDDAESGKAAATAVPSLRSPTVGTRSTPFFAISAAGRKLVRQVTGNQYLHTTTVHYTNHREESPASASTHLHSYSTADPALLVPPSTVAMRVVAPCTEVDPHFFTGFTSSRPRRSSCCSQPVRCCCAFSNRCRTVATGHSL